MKQIARPKLKRMGTPCADRRWIKVRLGSETFLNRDDPQNIGHFLADRHTGIVVGHGRVFAVVAPSGGMLGSIRSLQGV